MAKLKIWDKIYKKVFASLADGCCRFFLKRCHLSPSPSFPFCILIIIVSKVLKDFPLFHGNSDMLDNLMDFSPRDKNKLIFSSRAAAARTMVLWEYTNGYLSRCKAGGKQKGKRRIEKTRQKLWWHFKLWVIHTMVENQRKSLMQHCEQSELLLHLNWTKVH